MALKTETEMLVVIDKKDYFAFVEMAARGEMNIRKVVDTQELITASESGDIEGSTLDWYSSNCY